MLRSFNSLAFRQLRTRPLRSALTAFGVVLGVGMVFGVLLLAGTIRATFDEVIDSAWGETDLIVMGEGSGTMAEDSLDEIKDVRGCSRCRRNGRRHVHAARTGTTARSRAPRARC